VAATAPRGHVPAGQEALPQMRRVARDEHSTLGWGAKLASDPQLTAPPGDVTLRSTSPDIDAGRVGRLAFPTITGADY